MTLFHALLRRGPRKGLTALEQGNELRRYQLTIMAPADEQSRHLESSEELPHFMVVGRSWISGGKTANSTRF